MTYGPLQRPLEIPVTEPEKADPIPDPAPAPQPAREPVPVSALIGPARISESRACELSF